MVDCMGGDDRNDVGWDMIPVCPGVVPIEALVDHNDWAAVVVQGARAWVDGFRLVVRAYCRNEPDTERSAEAQGLPSITEVLGWWPVSGGGPGHIADNGELLPTKVRVFAEFLVEVLGREPGFVTA